jgi:hypothetical protein
MNTFIRRFNIGMLFRAYLLEYLIAKVFGAIKERSAPYCDICESDTQCTHHVVHKIDIISNFTWCYAQTVLNLTGKLTRHFFLLRAERDIQAKVAARNQQACCPCLELEITPAALGNLINDCRFMEAIFERLINKANHATASHFYPLWQTSQRCKMDEVD